MGSNLHPDFFAVAASKDRDPDGSKLRQALAAHVAIEQNRAFRAFLVHVLAGVGVPVWLSAAWPQWIPSAVRSPALTLWAMCLAALAVTGISEWSWLRRQAALQLALEPSTTRRLDHEGDSQRPARSSETTDAQDPPRSSV